MLKTEVAACELLVPLQQGLDQLGLLLTNAQQTRLLDYVALIQKWNKVYNLTAVRDPVEMLTHHVLDSLTVVAPLRRHTGGRPIRLLDVGSGAGLPGVVIATVCPEIEVHCVDTVSKKAAFIRQAAGMLALPNLHAVHACVEALALPAFDVITARAFANLSLFVKLTEPQLAPHGVWMAMKGKMPDAEIAALPPGIEVFHVEQLTVPTLDSQRCLVWLRRRRRAG